MNVEPYWMSIAGLHAESGHVDLFDANPSGAISVTLPRGDYQIRIGLGKIANDEGIRVCGLRIVLPNAIATIREDLGTIDIDTGAIRFGDLQGARALVNENERIELDDLIKSAPSAQVFAVCEISFESSIIQFFACAAANGDGTYPVFALRNGNTVIGIEVRFAEAEKVDIDEIQNENIVPVVLKLPTCWQAECELANRTGLTRETVARLLKVQSNLAWEQAKMGYPIAGIGCLATTETQPREMVMPFGPDAGKVQIIPGRKRAKFRVFPSAWSSDNDAV